MRDRSPTGVPEALMSDVGRAWGSGVWAWSMGLLACTGEAACGKVGGLSGPETTLSTGTSTHSCMVAASTSQTEHAGTAQWLSAVESSCVRSITESPELTWERTSLNMVSNYSCILARRSSSFSADFSLHSVALAWILLITLAFSSSFLMFCSHCLWSSSHWANHLQLPQSCAEVECSFSLGALILFSHGSCSGGWEWHQEGQYVVLNWTLPQCLLGDLGSH